MQVGLKKGSKGKMTKLRWRKKLVEWKGAGKKTGQRGIFDGRKKVRQASSMFFGTPDAEYVYSHVKTEMLHTVFPGKSREKRAYSLCKNYSNSSHVPLIPPTKDWQLHTSYPAQLFEAQSSLFVWILETFFSPWIESESLFSTKCNTSLTDVWKIKKIIATDSW